MWIHIRNADPDPQSCWKRIQFGSGSKTLFLPKCLTSPSLVWYRIAVSAEWSAQPERPLPGRGHPGLPAVWLQPHWLRLSQVHSSATPVVALSAIHLVRDYGWSDTSVWLQAGADGVLPWLPDRSRHLLLLLHGRLGGAASQAGGRRYDVAFGFPVLITLFPWNYQYRYPV